MVILNSDEIDKIKKNNYYNVIIDEEREKELNELYRQQNNKVDKIKFINNYDSNYLKLPLEYHFYLSFEIHF